MNNIEKILEEFEEFFNRFTNKHPKFHSENCRGHLHDKNCLVIEIKKSIKPFLSESIQQALAEERERIMRYLWKQIQDDYVGCSIEYFLKDQAGIMKIDLLLSSSLDKLTDKE